jgi:hypothetical protein
LVAEVDMEGDESGLSSDIVVDGAYRILPQSPLTELDRPGAPAYAARDQRNPKRKLFANVCDPGVLPRVDTLVQLKTLREASVIRPVAWDPVPWPRARQRCFAVVYEHPEEAPIMKSLHDRVPAHSTEFLVSSVLGPLSMTLALIFRRGQAHRAISPDNMYRLGETGETVLLGDCVTSPPGWSQQAVMEPIEYGMTPRESRGPGGFSEDIYALGASMLFLALGWCPVADFDDEDIIEAKAWQGSFMALLNGERPPVGLREPLRGMLNDDPLERWGLDDIEQWIGGVLRRSVQPSRELRANRPFEFQGVEHRNCRTLAHAFGKAPGEAAPVIRSKEFDGWLVRGVSDAMLEDQVGEILVYSGSKKSGSSEHIMVSRVCAALDPQGPFRYKGMIADPQSLGATLAAAMYAGDKEKVQIIGECIAEGIPSDWLKQRALNVAGDFSNLEKEFRRLQQLFKHTGPGYGLERALYEMNPFAPCRSEHLKNDYVYSLRDLLPALEQVVSRTGDLPVLVDRHIAAFIAARLKGPTEQILSTIEGDQPNSLKSKLAMCRLLGMVQRDYGPDSVPNLAAWLGDELAPAIDQFRSQSVREELTQKLPDVIARGDLLSLHEHVNSSQLIKRDKMAKAQAKHEFAEASAKIDKLVSKEFQQDALRTGWSIAAGGCMMLAVGTIAILVVW